MRPQQQNRRMRGRNGGGNNNNNNNNNNRRGPNPLTRNYESNGPDVKIRGSAQQIAEKYAQLARDAQSSGDRVMAENYLQHAEHYNRIIAAAQAQMPIQNVQNQREPSDDDLDDERDDFGNGNNTVQANGGSQDSAQGHQDAPVQGGGQNNGDGDPAEAPQVKAEAGAGPQPVIEGVPAEVALNPEASGEGTQSRARRNNNPGPDGEARRSRRPRRGERSRPEAGNDASDDQGGLATTLSRGTPPAPSEVPDEPKAGGDAALADAEG